MKKITTRTAEITLEDAGYITVRYLPFAEIDIQESRENNAVTAKLTNGKKFPALVDARALMHMSKEARAFNADPVIRKNSLAAAIVIETSVSRFLANMFIKFNKPGFPVKIFTDKKAAVKWLFPFVEKVIL